jgi:hypothetical protein
VTISSEGQGFMYVSDNQGQDSMFQISGAFFSRRARKQAIRGCHQPERLPDGFWAEGVMEIDD